MKSDRTACGTLAVLAVTAILLPSAVLSQWQVPDELSSKLNSLDTAQVEFITSGAPLDYLPERQLEHELSVRDGESLSTFVSDLMSVAEQMGYDPTRDMGAAPLDLKGKYFNFRSMVTAEPLRDEYREPGPFSVNRYLFPKSGVRTFGGAKVAIWPEDLVAGGVDVAIVGIPSDMSSGRRDASAGPDWMRALDTISTPDAQSLVNPLEALSVVDYGNFSADNMGSERHVDHIAGLVAETAGTGAIPMLVGGDTSILIPGVMGVAQVHGAGSFGLLHFSAHPDARRHEDHTISDRQAVFRVLDQGLVRGGDTIQVGLRGADVTADTLQWLRDRNVRYHTMTEIEQRGYDRVLKQVLKEVDRGPDAFFVSIDVSVIRPTEMIAAGRLAAGGLSVDQVTRAIRSVCAEKEIVGFEITDMAPMHDAARLSVFNANAVLNSCLNGIAVRRSGLAADYVHPLALGHGQR